MRRRNLLTAAAVATVLALPAGPSTAQRPASFSIDQVSERLMKSLEAAR